MSRYFRYKIHPKNGSRFVICKDRDGCDETFDIICRITDEAVASVYFWDADVKAKRVASRLLRALDDLYAFGGHFHIPALIKVDDKHGPYGSDAMSEQDSTE